MALTGLYLWHKVQPRDMMLILACLVIYFAAACWSYYLMRAGILYQGYWTVADKPEPVKPAPQNLNASEYNQTIAGIRFDARKNFCNIVLARLEHGYAKVDLTEKYWLIRKPRKWQGTPDEFTAMMREWEGDVFERKDARRNSPYIVRSIARLRDKAEGRL